MEGFASLPDPLFTPLVTVHNDDHTAALWQVRGTQLGELMGLPTTGKGVTITAAAFYHFSASRSAAPQNVKPVLHAHQTNTDRHYPCLVLLSLQLNFTRDR